ncbi:MAG TPA: sugar phosphate nucleotidyltransferase [Methylomirabilota bacterium]|nr:sugar phosphate nucleotidyltransferase [Methylomirabilota bacterium]
MGEDHNRAAAPPGEGRGERWALVLAGGDGARLRPLTRELCGDDRPKQFCPVMGGRTLLEATWARLDGVITPPHRMAVVTRRHEPFYAPVMARLRPAELVVQPDNRGTAPGILYPLLKLAARAPAAAVAVLPSDHHVSDDARFMTWVEAAFEAAAARPDRLVLLGMIPDSPESEYGWIEPGDLVSPAGPRDLYCVTRFWEKPPADLAQSLRRRGCLWNSFVMVGAVETFLAAIACALPALYGALDNVAPAFGGAVEAAAVRAAYAALPAADFSRQVLTPSTSRLAVLPVTGVAWSDLGSPDRVWRAWQQPSALALAGAGTAA